MISKPTTEHRLNLDGAQLTIGADDSGCWATYCTTAGAGNSGPRVPLLVLEVYDRALLRMDRLEHSTVDRLERADGAIHVIVSDRARMISVGAWIRPFAGGFSVTISPAEVYESRPELHRLFAVDLMPGLMRCGPDGSMLLPINTGVLCHPAGKPARADRFLIYGQQTRWELLPTLPVCAAQTPAGGLLSLAATAAGETECRISTDGAGNGTVGMSFHWRSVEVDPVEQDVRVIRFHPIPPGADITNFTADVLRQHVMQDLGKPTLQQRAKESTQVAHLLGAYIMKLFYGMQSQGIMMDGNGNNTAGGGAPRYLLTMTFDEANQGLTSLHDAGVDRIYIQNVGWNYRGHDGAYPTRFPVEERAGGEAAFRQLIAARHAAGDAMTVHDNYIDAYTISPDFDPEVVTVDPYGQPQIRGFWAGGPSFLQWPSAFTHKHLEDQMRRVKALGIVGPYYLDGMGSPLYANHHPRHRGSRSEMARGIDRLLHAARGLFGSAATETGYLYCSITPDLVANPGGRHLLSLCRPDWPVVDLFDQIVPLWHLVMSGLVLTENQALGWKDTMQALLLNQHPRYEWSTRPGVQPVLDRVMIGKIAARHELLINQFGHLRTQRLVEHQRDASGIEQTTYEDGTRVQADFARGELVVNDQRIDPPAALVEPHRKPAAVAV